MEFIEDEPETKEFEFFLEKELDFGNYDNYNNKFDFDKVIDFDKPKLNKNNIQFHSYFDKFIFTDNELLYPINVEDGENSNHFEQQDSEPTSQWNDDRLYISDSSNRSKKETQSSHSSN